MADIVDAETRSRMMSRIRGKDTKPELALRQALRRIGLTGYRCHYAKAPGKPDIAFVGRRLAIFVDGAFWHGHPDHFTFGKSGDYWDAKIARNIERDRDVDRQLALLGWRVLRFWDFDVATNADSIATSVSQTLSEPCPSYAEDSAP